MTAGGHLEVAVIGGGIVGVAAAAHLAAAGATVTLYEREAIAAGASGRNSGVVQHPFDPILADLHLETVDLYRRLALDGPEPFALSDRPAGLLAVGHDTDAIHRLALELAGSHGHLGPTFLAPAEAARVEPALGPSVAACRLDIGYPVEPGAATRAYAAWARSLGAHLEVGDAAVPWIRGGSAVGVVVDGRSVAADAVLIAAGPWSARLIDPTNSWRPIGPLWGVVVELVLETPPRHVLEQADIDIEPPARELPVNGAGTGAAAPDGVDFSLVTTGPRSVLGSTFLRSKPDHEAMAPALVRNGTRFVPGIADARVGAARACARPLSFDGRPLLGRVPGIPRLWIAAGHGPWGISTGPASARLVADLMLGRVDVVPAQLDPARFGAPPAGR